MSKLEAIYQFNKQLLTQLNVDYQEWQHEPILDFATDDKVAKELGWTGTQSKSLFLKLKGGGSYALFLTDKETRLDSKGIKAVTGKRPSIVANEEMTEVTGCAVGAVCPIGLPCDVLIIVDRKLFLNQELLYTPGKPEFTFSLPCDRLKDILQALDNPVIEL